MPLPHTGNWPIDGSHLQLWPVGREEALSQCRVNPTPFLYAGHPMGLFELPYTIRCRNYNSLHNYFSSMIFFECMNQWYINPHAPLSPLSPCCSLGTGGIAVIKVDKIAACLGLWTSGGWETLIQVNYLKGQIILRGSLQKTKRVTWWSVTRLGEAVGLFHLDLQLS